MVLHPTAKEREWCNRLDKNAYCHLFPRLDQTSSEALKFSLLCKNNITLVKLVRCRSCAKEQTEESQVNDNHKKKKKLENNGLTGKTCPSNIFTTTPWAYFPQQKIRRPMVLHPTATERERCNRLAKMHTGCLFPRLDRMSSKALMVSHIRKNTSTEEVKLVRRRSCTKEQMEDSQVNDNQPSYFQFYKKKKYSKTKNRRKTVK
jgi:hypothetical protein